METQTAQSNEPLPESSSKIKAILRFFGVVLIAIVIMLIGDKLNKPTSQPKTLQSGDSSTMVNKIKTNPVNLIKDSATKKK